MPEYVVHPIGHIENDITEIHNVHWEDIESRIVIDASLAEGLDGIEDFSHIIVVTYLHRQQDLKPGGLRVHPESRPDTPLVGVFATRSPRRPNPIGITTVPLLRRDSNVLIVRGLDMANGTPVIDLKPYLPVGDSIEGATAPGWLRRLWGTLHEGGEEDAHP
jgi:tRNA-Thr(GGU) m(6)t(6)A37 methyltransferase TsaA